MVNMPTVKFNDPEDFLAELAKDKEKVDRGIVRLVYSFTPTKVSPNIQHLSVVATALVGTQVYRLETYCGDLWRIEGQGTDRESYEEACAVVGVDPGASWEEVRRVYLAKVQFAHPDKGGDEARFKRLQKAYEYIAKVKGQDHKG